MQERFHLSVWSIRNPVPIIVLFLMLALSGLFTFGRLGIDSTPNIDVPVVNVRVIQNGAGPTEMETEVTRKIEDAVAGLGNIDNIRSVVLDGYSNTAIAFEIGTDSDQVTNEVRNAVSQIRSELPQTIEDPIVDKLDFAGGAIMAYTVSSDQRSIAELRDLIDRKITRSLLSVPGVAQIDRLGGVNEAIRVDLDPSRLLSYGITATDVNNQVRALNLDRPGGRTELGNQEQTVRALGNAKSVDDLRNYRVVLGNGDTVRLEDLGAVSRKFSDPREAAILDAKTVVGFEVLRSTGSNLVSVEEGVRNEVVQLQEQLPEDVSLSKVFTLADEVRDSYRATFDALIIGSILTTLVVGTFLRNWRVTVITAIALPLSIIPTFLVMGALNYTLNGMTLLALALAIGNLVDDAICMIENIDQHMAMGKHPRQAAMDAAREIGLAVVATTATVVAVFLPVAFIGGIPGQFFQPFGITFAVCTMFSTLVAVTMTPLLSAYWLKPKDRSGGFDSSDPLDESGDKPPGPYRRALTWALGHRVITLIIALVIFIGSLQLVPFIPKGLFGGPENNLSIVSVSLPPGSTLKDTTEVSLQADRLLRNNPLVESVFANINDVDEATLFVTLVPGNERSLTRSEFEDETRSTLSQIPGARIAYRTQGGGGDGDKDLSLVLRGDDPESLQAGSEQLEREMAGLPGLADVTSSASLVKPELAIIPDFQRAADLGVSVQAIAQTASLATIGDIQANQAKFNLSDRQIPIEVKLNRQSRSDIDTLKNLKVPGRNGQLFPLSSVADLKLVSGPAQINRYNRTRQVSLEANLDGISLGQAVEKVRELPARKNLPPDVSEAPSGDAEIMRDIFSRFVGALLLAVLAIYCILVLLYNDFLYPVSILTAVPFSFGGALVALLVTQKELGLFALIGIVLLVGLVTKNAILLVDFALEGQRRGYPQFKAVVAAGVSRFRPILMTSLSTIAGMMPIALELGAGASERSPMAITVIGGFCTSTLLTLVVVPVLFTYVDGFNYWIKQKLGFVPKRPRTSEGLDSSISVKPEKDRNEGRSPKPALLNSNAEVSDPDQNRPVASAGASRSD